MLSRASLKNVLNIILCGARGGLIGVVEKFSQHTTPLHMPKPL